MTLEINNILLAEIQQHGQAAYPEEAAGMLLGNIEGERKRVLRRLQLHNAREDSARHNRYLLTADDYLSAEQEAARLGLDVIGVYHSHPDHPNRPSDFDREWAMPWFSYLITSVQEGQAQGSRSWQLAEDRSNFIEETIILVHKK
ncbi:MAG: M67 family metallopeptidase [Anaerolineales bacterium]|jgi:proteasome lid subunit RPN8/RPN11